MWKSGRGKEREKKEGISGEKKEEIKSKSGKGAARVCGTVIDKEKEKSNEELKRVRSLLNGRNSFLHSSLNARNELGCLLGSVLRSELVTSCITQTEPDNTNTPSLLLIRSCVFRKCPRCLSLHPPV